MPVIATSELRSMIEAELPHLIELRHDLHAHPELGYEEHRTSRVVQQELEAAGVDFVGGLAGGTGVVGHLTGEDHDGGAIGLRADIDALPIVEQTNLPYASTEAGRMHACGHDGHTAMLIGAARVLSRIAGKTKLPRPVTFVFQPAEEGGAGGRAMVKDGCLSGRQFAPAVGQMYGLHGWPQLPLGVVGTKVGPLLAAADMFNITITGTGSHAAFPHFGHDPVVCGAAMISAIQTIASRSVDPLDSIVVSVTQFHAGRVHNIIEDTATLGGTVRTLLPETQELALKRLKEIATSVAAAHGCEAELDYQVGYPVTLNSDEAVDVFNDVAIDTLGEQRVVEVPHPFMGGEDFSFYCHEVPSCFFILGLLPAGQHEMPALHQPTFDFNDDAIATGVEVFCQLALRDA
jgi:amidohydrolase